MSIRNLIVGIALLSVAATAQAGWIAVLPESATVTLIFVALAVIAFSLRRASGESTTPASTVDDSAPGRSGVRVPGDGNRPS